MNLVAYSIKVAILPSIDVVEPVYALTPSVVCMSKPDEFVELNIK